MRRVLDRLGSVRLTIGLLAALCIVFLVGVAVPQKQILQREGYEAWARESPTLVGLLEALALTDVYRSPLVLALWGLFFANLAVVMARRIPAIVARTRVDGPIPAPASPGFGRARELDLQGRGVDEVARGLEARGFAVHVEPPRVRAVRHRLSPLATLVFHLSFFLVAAGGITSYLTRFEGMLDLGEGERAPADLERYAPPKRMPKVGEAPRLDFVVESIQPEVEGNVPVAIRILVRDGALRLHGVEVNRPWKPGTASVVFKDLGVAPLLLVRDAAGREVFGGYMKLKIGMGRKDQFTVLGQSVEAELFPDHVVVDGRDATRSQEMRDPVLRLTVTALSGRQVRASLRPGQSMAIGPYTLTFADWRWWTRLFVRAERGLWAIWLGFGLGTAAAALRLLRYRRELVLERTPAGTWLLSGRADYYRVLFEDEVDALVEDLREERAERPAAISG